MMSWRPGSAVLPWLKMITASAPAASALSALVPNAQAPRWISAMSSVPDQSSPIEVGRLATRGRRVAEPEVEVDRDHVAVGDDAGTGVLHRLRRRSASRSTVERARVLGVEAEVEHLTLDDEAGVFEQVGDVVGRLVVAGRARGAGAAVGVGDVLQRVEVHEHVVGVDALEQLVDLVQVAVVAAAVRWCRGGGTRDCCRNKCDRSSRS